MFCVFVFFVFCFFCFLWRSVIALTPKKKKKRAKQKKSEAKKEKKSEAKKRAKQKKKKKKKNARWSVRAAPRRRPILRWVVARYRRAHREPPRGHGLRVHARVRRGVRGNAGDARDGRLRVVGARGDAVARAHARVRFRARVDVDHAPPHARAPRRVQAPARRTVLRVSLVRLARPFHRAVRPSP